MYGSVTSFNLDMPTGESGPEPGQELLIVSPAGRSRRGYVVESVRPVTSPVHTNRYKLRIMHVPFIQLKEPVEVVRYGKKLLDRWRGL